MHVRGTPHVGHSAPRWDNGAGEGWSNCLYRCTEVPRHSLNTHRCMVLSSLSGASPACAQLSVLLVRRACAGLAEAVHGRAEAHLA